MEVDIICDALGNGVLLLFSSLEADPVGSSELVDASEVDNNKELVEDVDGPINGG